MKWRAKPPEPIMPSPHTSNNRTVRSILVAICLIAVGFGSFGFVTTASAADERDIKAAIERGVEYLKQNAGTSGSGQASLAAYAMLKAEVPPDDPAVAKILVSIAATVKDGEYKSVGGKVAYYAGVQLMALEAADSERYQPQMEAIAKFLIESQDANGGWDYAGVKGQGDTSVTQYATLGLWAAARAGVEIPAKTWDKIALWHITFQTKDGGFNYHPTIDGRTGGTQPLTAAGAGSMMVTRLMLFPNGKAIKAILRAREQAAKQPQSEGRPGKKAAAETKPKKDPRKKKYGFLEPIDLSKTEEERKDAATTARTEKVEGVLTMSSRLDAAIFGSLIWSQRNWSPSGGGMWPRYYLYGVERMAALAALDELANHNWYDEGADLLLKIQDKANGSWPSRSSGVVPGTSFAVLFLTKATAKQLGWEPKPKVPVGSGLLAGGRGLPDNLQEVNLDKGDVKVRKISKPIEVLLAELANPKSLEVEAIQEALIDKAQIGDRRALIGKKDLLIRLLRDPRSEVRRTAVWALGRSDDLRVAKKLIAAFDDRDVDVLVEVRNALCLLSRKPSGLGLSKSPLSGLAENADEAERLRTIAGWRRDAIEKWTAWYRKIRPYDERDDLGGSKRNKR